MATAEEIRQEIAQARREVQEEERRGATLEQEITEAIERGRLRQELAEIRLSRDEIRDQNCTRKTRRFMLDSLCTHPVQGARVPDRTSERAPPNREGTIDIATSISKGEYIWSLKGMSWLEDALTEQQREDAVCSDEFSIGGAVFELFYSPTCGPVGIDDQAGSLGVLCAQESGVIFRYKMFIKRAGGEFVQWGAEGKECRPEQNMCGVAFGPDVQDAPEEDVELERPLGIFGLTHDALVRSEWVEDDTLTAKIQIEVMSGSRIDEVPRRPVVTVPPPKMATNLLSMLEEAKHADTTFVVEDRQIKAHAVILAAGSEVFDRELNGSMQESLSKVVEIKDIDFDTFDVFLHFLYTDDLDRVEAMISSQVESQKPQAAAGSSDDAASAGNPHAVILQNLLAVSHKYQVRRLQLWCEQQLCEFISKEHVCSIFCQAHLYEASELEKACLSFIRQNIDSVMVTRGFGRLSEEWPQVMLKVNLFCAGLSEASAADAIAAHEEARRKRRAQESVQDISTAGTKHARSE